MIRRFLGLVTAIGITLVAAMATAASGATTIDPCALLTHDQVVAATGLTWELPLPDPSPDADADAECEFVRPDAGIEVRVTEKSSAKAAQTAVKNSKYGLSNSSGATGARTVKGIGDRALYVFDKPFAGDYLVWSEGKTFVEISFHRNNRTSSGVAVVKQLAKTAAGNVT